MSTILSTLQSLFTPHFWLWIVFAGCVTAWILLRYLVIPIHKRQQILQSIAYCPSLLLPQLPPERNVTTFIPSHKLKYLSYRVNLFHLTCTCSRFRLTRGYYPVNDIRRLCRHLRRELDATQSSLSFDELTRGVIAFRLRDACYVREPLPNSEMVVGFHPRSSIIRVYTYRKHPDDPPQGPFTGPVDKFTYNNQQEIWVYGEPPPNSEKILTVLARIMTGCKTKYPHQDLLPPSRNHLITPIVETEEMRRQAQLRRQRSADQVSTTPLRADQEE
ncbi:MAG: hypothetical protein HQM02_02245 [Magnetococcales bacterium]|nr:hypothetical protein [Magnetococcales bacterium]